MIYLEKKEEKKWAVDASTRPRVHASTRPRIHASARPHDGSTRGRWMLCTHPPFLGLQACNKMGSTPVLPRKIRQNQQQKKKNLRGDFRPLPKKKISILRPYLSSTFPQGFRISKKFGHLTLGSGGKIGFKIYHAKRDRHADTHTDIATSRSIGPSGPIR